MTTLKKFIESVEFRRYKNGRAMPMACVALGLIGETGEVADIVKKHLWHGKPLDREHFIEELGDVAWYAVASALTQDRHVTPMRSPLGVGLAEDVEDLFRAVAEVVTDAPYEGVVLDYLADLASHVGATLDDVLEANMRKLDKRYPKGFVEGGGVR